MKASTQYALVIDCKVVAKGSAKRMRSAKNTFQRTGSTNAVRVWLSPSSKIGAILK